MLPSLGVAPGAQRAPGKAIQQVEDTLAESSDRDTEKRIANQQVRGGDGQENVGIQRLRLMLSTMHACPSQYALEKLKQGEYFSSDGYWESEGMPA